MAIASAMPVVVRMGRNAKMWMTFERKIEETVMINLILKVRGGN